MEFHLPDTGILPDMVQFSSLAALEAGMTSVRSLERQAARAFRSARATANAALAAQLDAIGHDYELQARQAKLANSASSTTGCGAATEMAVSVPRAGK
jgi:hypothetical protein